MELAYGSRRLRGGTSINTCGSLRIPCFMTVHSFFLSLQVLCAWPRVCMGRPFNLKFDDIVWQQSDEHLQAWKDGKTGFPIVDAVRLFISHTLISLAHDCLRHL